MNTLTTFLIETAMDKNIKYELHVISLGKEGVDWDYPIKPNEEMNKEQLMFALNLFDWGTN